MYGFTIGRAVISVDSDARKNRARFERQAAATANSAKPAASTRLQRGSKNVEVESPGSVLGCLQDEGGRVAPDQPDSSRGLAARPDDRGRQAARSLDPHLKPPHGNASRHVRAVRANATDGRPPDGALDRKERHPARREWSTVDRDLPFDRHPVEREGRIGQRDALATPRENRHGEDPDPGDPRSPKDESSGD